MKFRVVIAASILAMGGVPTVHAQAMAGTYSVRAFTPELAVRAANAALQHCRNQGYQVGVAVADRSGLLVALVRDRYAGPHTVDMASNKAWTAASFKTSTLELAKQTQPGQPMSGIRQLQRVIAAGGGVPVEAAGSLLGAIGVSGGPGGDADEACASAGLRAIEELIN